jgi:hypothetical protein
MGTKWTAGTRIFAAAAVAGLLTVGVAACGVTFGESAGSPARTAAESAPASHAPGAKSAQAKSASRAHDTSAEASAATTGKLPDYQPATIVSKSSTTTVLKSPDSLTKVGTFYKDALARGGWDTTSASMGSFHASFTAHRAHEGVSISVYPRFGGSGISISQYPV